MASPSLRAAIAFCQDGRRPAYRPYVRRLARTILVRTPVTDTLNNDSMAALICGLLASEWTRNAYSLRAPYAADDFSVTTGRTMVLGRSGIVRLLLTGTFVQRADFHDHRLRPEDLVRRRIGEAHHVHVRDIAGREIDVVRITCREHQDLLARCAQLPKQCGEILRLRLLVRQGVNDHERAFARARVERRLLRELPHLLGNRQPVAARMRPVRDAAGSPVRCP